MRRSLFDFFANVLLQIPQVLFSLAAALLTLTWEHDFRSSKMFCLYFEVVLQPIVGQEYKFFDGSWGILRVADLLSSKWPLILSCLFVLNFDENCIWQVWLQQIKCIFTGGFEVEKGSQNWFCLHCDFDNEELKGMHWKCNALASLYILKLFYESFYWNYLLPLMEYLLLLCSFHNKMFISSEVVAFEHKLRDVKSYKMRA